MSEQNKSDEGRAVEKSRPDKGANPAPTGLGGPKPQRSASLDERLSARRELGMDLIDAERKPYRR